MTKKSIEVPFYEIFDHGIDRVKGCVDIGYNDCDNEHVASILRRIYWHDTYGPGKITLFLNCPGGDDEAAMAIYDTLRHIKSETLIVCVGAVYSNAMIILQAGTLRYSLPNVRFMVHPGTNEVDKGSPQEVSAAGDEGKFTLKRYKDILYAKIKEKHKRYKRSDLEKAVDQCRFFSAQEAQELGLLDKVLSPRTRR